MVDLTNFDIYYRDFELAQTPEEKSKLIELFTSENEISDEDLCELKSQINDMIENESIEQDSLINFEIEDGSYKLHTCIESIDQYKSGCNYYVKKYDARDLYQSSGIGDSDPLISEMINSIKPVYWIITDDGIGTLKRKNILSKDIDFQKYFTKFV